jgi:hypothetical protein
MQMQRQVDELEAEAAQISDVSEEAAAEYHSLRQVSMVLMLQRLLILCRAFCTAAC